MIIISCSSRIICFMSLGDMLSGKMLGHSLSGMLKLLDMDLECSAQVLKVGSSIVLRLLVICNFI